MSSFFENNYFNTYYYANIINNILSRDIELIGFISQFFNDEEAILYLVKPFQKFSALHCFISETISNFFDHDMNEYDQRVFGASENLNIDKLRSLYAEIAFESFDIDDSFRDFIGSKQEITYKDIEAYHEELTLTGRFEQLFINIAEEVFYILFNNRRALLEFNRLVSEYVLEVVKEDIEEEEFRLLFAKDGKLKRQRIPEWAKKAVFFRDRGKCCLCHVDLSGTLSLSSEKHFDHIIPLALGGLNDVSNLQLLCSACNQKKSQYAIVTSDFYEAWY